MVRPLPMTGLPRAIGVERTDPHGLALDAQDRGLFPPCFVRAVPALPGVSELSVAPYLILVTTLPTHPR